MRALLLASLVSGLACGCTLDIGRLYGVGGERDGGTEELDGGDTMGLDVPRPEDGGVRGLSLSITASAAVTAGSDVDAANATGVSFAAVTIVGGGFQVFEVGARACASSFMSRTSEATGYPGPLTVASIDGDRAPDLVVGAPMGRVSTFLGVDLTVGRPSTHALGMLTALDLANFDGDGQLDLLAVEGGAALRILPGNGLGGFSAPMGVDGPGDSNVDGAFADLDDDGRIDVVTVVKRGQLSFFEFHRSAEGSVALEPPRSAMVGGTRLAVGSLDGLVTRAFVVGGTSLEVVSTNATALEVDTRDLGATAAPVDVVIAELDGIAPAEIVISDQTANRLQVLHWSPGRLEVVDELRLTGPRQLSAVDVDGDGRDELVVLADGAVVLVASRCP